MLKLLSHPHQALKTRCEEDEVSFDESLQQLVNEMTMIMYENNGIGLAAVQLGVIKKVIIVDPSSGELKKDFMVMVNPKFSPTPFATTEILEEGCLSMPGVHVKVSRWSDIEVEYHDVSGVITKSQLSGLTARIVQHEIDHLNGKTLLDRGKVR